MEDDDDEFGDLYTDVLRPISFPVSAASAVAPPPPPASFSSAAAATGGPRFDPGSSSSSGEERIFFGSSFSATAVSIPSQTLASPTKDDGDGDGGEDGNGSNWMLGQDPAVAEEAANWGEDDDDDDERVSFRPASVDADCIPAVGMTSVLEDDYEEETMVPGISGVGAEIAGVGGIQAMEEMHEPIFGGVTGEDPDELGQAFAIPGLSAGPPSSGTILSMSRGDAKPAQSEDWDSDSEDDLQIVLNDNGHGFLGVERNNLNGADDDDEDGEEDLVILTDEDQHLQLPIIEEQQWGEEAMQNTGDNDKKETGDMPKVLGAPGILAGTRTGYSNHGFHAQHHSLYKQYVRPGATSVSGSPVAGVVPSATRPPLTSGPTAGRGRGDWRPTGGRGIGPAQKSYTGFGVPSWASGSGVRASGSGLDFTLPVHKTIFDIDIENFDEKPWKYPGADVSDFFNFGLDEDKWKDYCKQLEQLRLEATMQSKIRVYESGRSEQDYDPDLPPELAAAAGHHDVSADGGHTKADSGQVDCSAQGRGPAIMRPPIPTGRPIQVESGYGERLPSIDTRPPRNRDSDAVIEIVLQDSFDDPKVYNDVVEQPGKDLQKDRAQGSHENEDERKLVSGYSTRCKHRSGRQNKDITHKIPSVSEGDRESPAERHHASRRSPLHSDTSYGSQNRNRLPRGHSHGRCDTAHEHLDDVMPRQSAHSKCFGNNKKEKLADEGEINKSSETSAAIDDTAREVTSMEQNCDEKDEKLPLINEIEDDTNVDSHISSKSGDENLTYSSKTPKLSSRVEQINASDVGYEDDLRTSNSGSSREKSGSSKGYLRRHENGEESRMDECLKHREGDEHSYRHKDDYSRGAWQEMDGSRNHSKGREDLLHSYQHRDGWDSNSPNPARARNFEKAKDSEVTARCRREDSLHGRRVNTEDMRGETSDETMTRHSGKLRSGYRNNRDGDFHSGKQSGDKEWRGHSREGSSRQKEKDTYLINRPENLDDPLIKRKKDEYLIDENTKMKNKEDSSQRKREREDVLDRNRKKDENTIMREKTDNQHSAKHKDDSWRYKEREDKQRLKQPRESALSHRDREQGQGLLKTTRAAEGKPLSRVVRYKEELTTFVSDRDYQDKDRRLPNENVKRGERTREDSLPQKKRRGDVPSRGKQSNIDERSSRHERISLHGDRPPIASNNQQMYKERHRGNQKKNKDIKVNEQSNQVLGKRHEGRNSRRNEKTGVKGLNEPESNNVSSATFSKKDGQVHQQLDVQSTNSSLRKQGVDDPASDNENQQGSRRGRSKLERWTSNKKREYGVIDNKQKLSVPSRAMDIDGNNIDAVRAEELPKTEVNNNAVDVDGKVVDVSNLVEKMEDRDPHVDTVAKLKRRSERFKLPMPSEKEMASSRKQDNELQAPQSEAAMTDTEVRPERPARKRRWNGS